MAGNKIGGHDVTDVTQHTDMSPIKELQLTIERREIPYGKDR